MAVEVKIPNIGESITEAMIAVWYKNVGDYVQQDEALAEIESDKATLELPAPVAGRIVQLLKQPNEYAKISEVIALIDDTVAADAAAPASKAAPASAEVVAQESAAMPSARRLLAEKGVAAATIKGSGKGGRVLKEDVLKADAAAAVAAAPVPAVTPAATQAVPLAGAPLPVSKPAAIKALTGGGEEEIVPLSPIRKRIAERLMQAQHGAALLTTFNEVDMSAVAALRKQYQERFVQRFGVKLGFMSFFVKAAIEALKIVPQVNAEIRGDAIVYKNYYDIGIAVSGAKGLAVPVLRGAHLLGFGEIELAIADFAARAQTSKLELSELKGGTFTISNGGVFGSLMSTPIVNPPQSAVLGLHAIQERPVAREGQVVIRPMMYIALTYDHRLIDGRESVTFLKHVKELIEDPARVLLEI